MQMVAEMDEPDLVVERGNLKNNYSGLMAATLIQKNGEKEISRRVTLKGGGTADLDGVSSIKYNGKLIYTRTADGWKDERAKQPQE